MHKLKTEDLKNSNRKMKAMRSKEKYRAAENRDRESGRTALLVNEDGSVIILALIMLMLLTMVGISATDTSTVEIQVAGNERHYKQNFFKTEAAALQGSQRIQDAPTYTETWIIDDDTYSHTYSPRTNFDNIANWSNLSGLGSQYSNTYSLVLYGGVAPWSSLDMTSPTQVRVFNVYGQMQDPANNESLIIETGFARRM
jgi:Tfp pilus assembly protein PilX